MPVVCQFPSFSSFYQIMICLLILTFTNPEAAIEKCPSLQIFDIQFDSTTLEQKDHFCPDLGLFGPHLATKLFWRFQAQVDVRHCPKLQSCIISRKTNEANLRKWGKP